MTENDPLGAVAASEQHDPTQGVRVRQSGKTPKPGPTGRGRNVASGSAEPVVPDGGDDTSAIPDGVPMPPADAADDAFAAAVTETRNEIADHFGLDDSERSSLAAAALIRDGRAEIPIHGHAVGSDGLPIGEKIELGTVTLSVDDLDPDLVLAVLARAFGPLPDVEVSTDGLKAYVPLSTGPTMTVQLSDRPEIIREFVSAALALYYHVLEIQV